MKERLIRILQISEPISNKMLALMLEVSGRKARRMVQELRHANYPIGYGKKGYFLAKDRLDLQHTINTFITRNRTNVESRYDLEHANFDIWELRKGDRDELIS